MTKESKALELEDYQPRGTEPLVRLSWNRSFPDGNTAPGFHAIFPRSMRESEPPMRDAVADLMTFLDDVHADLERRDLHAVEVSVHHQHGLVIASGESSGWAFTVDALALPIRVIGDQQKRFDEWQAKQLEETAAAK